MLKICVVGASYTERQMCLMMDFEVVDTIDKCDVALFTGGEDIDPSIYNHMVHSSVWPNTSRDHTELRAFKKARELGKGMFGICRGAQLLCACAGGSLYQDVQGHNKGPHKMNTDAGAVMSTTSVHHQMMVPPKGAIIEAWATHDTTGTRWDGETAEFVTEPIPAEQSVEAAWFPNIRAWGIQGHPEYSLNVADYAPFRAFVRQRLIHYFALKGITVVDDTTSTLNEGSLV